MDELKLNFHDGGSLRRFDRQVTFSVKIYRAFGLWIAGFSVPWSPILKRIVRCLFKVAFKRPNQHNKCEGSD
jgi:hypothetical protein